MTKFERTKSCDYPYERLEINCRLIPVGNLISYFKDFFSFLFQKKTPKTIKLTFYLHPDPSTGIKPFKK